MSEAAPQIGIGRMIVAVLGALVLFSVLTQQLEYTLVNAVGGDTVKDADVVHGRVDPAVDPRGQSWRSTCCWGCSRAT